MSHDTPLSKEPTLTQETPWARDWPVIPHAHTALAPLMLEAAGELAVGESVPLDGPSRSGPCIWRWRSSGASCRAGEPSGRCGG